MRTLLLSLGLLIACSNLWAQIAPKYSNEFLNIGVSARAFGMSNAVITSVNDVTAGYWNPAGLTKIKDNLQVSFMHSNYLAGIANYDYLGVGTKLKNGNALSFSMVRFGVDGIPYTVDLINNGQIDYNRVSEFSAVDYGFFASYAKNLLKEGLTIGGSAKIIHRSAGEFTKAWGFGIDLGAQYEAPSGLRLAAVARDVTTTFNAWNYSFTENEKDVFAQTGNEIPVNSLEITLPKFLLGAGYKWQFDEQFSLNAEANFAINTDGKRNTLIRSNFVSLDPSVGMELGFKDLVYARLGVGNFQQVQAVTGEDEWQFQPTAGIGLNLKQFSLDYAFTDIGNQSIALYSHVFSIRLGINPPDQSPN